MRSSPRPPPPVAQVDAILGMHGAGLTNGLYMKPGGAIIEVRCGGDDASLCSCEAGSRACRERTILCDNAPAPSCIPNG